MAEFGSTLDECNLGQNLIEFGPNLIHAGPIGSIRVDFSHIRARSLRALFGRQAQFWSIPVEYEVNALEARPFLAEVVPGSARMRRSWGNFVRNGPELGTKRPASQELARPSFRKRELINVTYTEHDDKDGNNEQR